MTELQAKYQKLATEYSKVTWAIIIFNNIYHRKGLWNTSLGSKVISTKNGRQRK